MNNIIITTKQKILAFLHIKTRRRKNNRETFLQHFSQFKTKPEIKTLPIRLSYYVFIKKLLPCCLNFVFYIFLLNFFPLLRKAFGIRTRLSFVEAISMALLKLFYFLRSVYTFICFLYTHTAQHGMKYFVKM